MEIYSIGFTKKTARQFFEILRNAGIRRLIDVRLNNTSQLAGFAKRDDLEFFLRDPKIGPSHGSPGNSCAALRRSLCLLSFKRLSQKARTARQPIPQGAGELSEEQPGAASLALIAPQTLRWCIAEDNGHARQLRAVFKHGGASYDLPVTDVEFERRMRGLPKGLHRFRAVGIPIASRFIYLLISLSEPFEGFCYKLVAGVIAI